MYACTALVGRVAAARIARRRAPALSLLLNTFLLVCRVLPAVPKLFVDAPDAVTAASAVNLGSAFPGVDVVKRE